MTDIKAHHRRSHVSPKASARTATRTAIIGDDRPEKL